MRRMVGTASTAKNAVNGRVTKKIWRRPSDRSSRNSFMRLPAAWRESAGKSTVPMATANIPCGSWNRRKALSMMAGAGTLMSVATMVATKALKFTMPRLMITGPMSTPTRRTCGLLRLSLQGDIRPPS